MADVGHLGPDLVGAAGLQLDSHQREGLIAGQHPVVGNGGFRPRPGGIKDLDPVGCAVF